MSCWERKLGKYAIRNLSLVLIVCYAIGFVISALRSDLLLYLTLNPHAILHGQVWRLVSWVLIPPPVSGYFWILIMLYFYYSIGTALERTWGTWLYNVYIFSGMLFTILGAFLTYALMQVIAPGAGEMDYMIMSMYYSTYYINMSIFLGYAMTFPDAQVLLMLFIPVRVKWLGIIYLAIIGVEFFQTPLFGKIAIIASLLNFFVFFFRSRQMQRFRPSELKRRNDFRKKMRANAPQQAGSILNADRKTTVHRCAICGRTEKDDPDLEFRYCSKCEGSFEYCQDHLFTHRHVKAGGAPSLDGEQS